MCEGIDIEVVFESHIAKLEGAQTHIYIKNVGFKSPPSRLAASVGLGPICTFPTKSD
jgi:hypothetical protein